jgi:hypothetical protein
MREEFSWLKDFDFGFCVAEDLAEWTSLGWRYLCVSDFEIDLDEWERAVGTRFGLTDAGGHVKWRDNYVMIQHKDFREKLLKERYKRADEATRRALEATAYADPRDPSYQENLQYSKDHTKFESDLGRNIRDEPEAEEEAVPKRRGRPPGSKNKQKTE